MDFAMSLKSIVYRGGRYARRRDRTRYDCTPVSGPVAPRQTTDGCLGVSLMGFMLGGLLFFVFPPLGAMVIFYSLLAGGLAKLFGCLTQRPQRTSQATGLPPPHHPQAEQSIEPEYLKC
jgi:hypothetical protein